MPTYEYRCAKCNKTFDEFQSITAKPIKKCKFCSGKVERLIGTGGGIIFKGSGFYETDYKRKSSPKKDSKPDTCPASKSDGCKVCPKNSS